MTTGCCEQSETAWLLDTVGAMGSFGSSGPPANPGPGRRPGLRHPGAAPPGLGRLPEVRPLAPHRLDLDAHVSCAVFTPARRLLLELDADLSFTV